MIPISRTDNDFQWYYEYYKIIVAYIDKRKALEWKKRNVLFVT